VVPLSRQRTNIAGLLVRTPTPAATSRAIEDALRGIDPRVRADTRVVQEAVATYLETRGRIAWMVAPGALLALVLAVLGIFAVTTFVVGQRMEEVSVRMAFGASPWDVTRLLVGDALRQVLIGTAAGVVAAYLVGRILASQLAEISPHDPLSIIVAVLLLTGAAVAAVLMPAGRAARTNPAALMRRA
jgi:predicted lysophospholipase L1 biosynthesis ABC-type transport system permease subunit